MNPKGQAHTGGMNTLVATRRTRSIAVRMIQAAPDEGHDAVRLVKELERGQELALVATLVGLIGGGNHQRPGPASVAAEPPHSHDLIVCGTCGARLHESCKTSGGRSRADHGDRLFPRRCPCGTTIPKRRGQRWCDQCAAVSRRANQRRYDQARRAQ